MEIQIPFVIGTLAVALGLIVVGMKTLRNGAPTESIAHVLHSTEHPVPARATAGRRP